MKKGIVLFLLMVLLTAFVHAETTIDLASERYGASEQTAVVVVTDKTLNTIRAGMFGANTSYRGGGYGIFDEETSTFNGTLIQMIKESGVTALRLPGGIEGDYFHWYESVGATESRVPQIDCFSMDYPTYTYKNGEPYLVLFGPDEWIELCNMTDTALIIQLNAGNGTPQEAVDFIRYCLDSSVTIDTITVGNEVCMAEERVEGVSVTKTPQKYVDFYNQVWKLMGEGMHQELSNRGILFGCIGIPMSHPLCAYRDWDGTVLAAMNGKTDFIDIHVAYSPYFVSGNNNEQIIKCLLASSEKVRKHLNVELASIEKHAPEVKIAIFEHGPIGAIPYSSGVPGGMYLASFFNVVLAEEKVIGAAYLPLTNHPAANNLLGYYNEAGENTSWDNVVSLVFRMYADQIGRDVLDAQLTGAKTFSSSAVGLMSPIKNVPEGETAVYYDRTTGEGTLFVLNKAYKENTIFDITMPFDNIEINAVTEIFTPHNTMYNNHTRPTMVQPKEYTDFCGAIENGKFTIITKPISLVKIDFATIKAP